MRLPLMKELMNMRMDSARQHLALHIAAQRDVIFWALCMCDANCVLLDNRPLVEIGRDVMRRGIDQLHPALVSLFIWV